jgi:beta-lactamase class A
MPLEKLKNIFHFNQIMVKKQYFYFGIFASFLVGSVLSFTFLHPIDAARTNMFPKDPNVKQVCHPASVRIRNYKYVKPLLFSDRLCETDHFLDMKMAANEAVNAFKASGDISSASIYLRDFDNGEWMNLNPYETYHPASLFKVPIMIAIMRMAEKQPGLLDKELLFNPPKDLNLPTQNYRSKSIEAGKKYTIRELLQYMISYSDNKANWLLKDFMDAKTYNDMFVDFCLGLPLPDQKPEEIQISAKDYSVFMRTLFNSTYLQPENSELAVSMMAACDFEDGFMKGMPAGTKMAHKFGEWDNHQEFQLHESGIIYTSRRQVLCMIE